MPRRKATSNVDISIRGDELEQNRIQLENNLQHTDLSLHLTSPDVDDVEFPRHNPGPDQMNGFMSFEHHSQDRFDPDENSQYNAWSYRTVDDEDGVDPYAGQTISTAAHHASALTLSAGLGRGTRRDVSLSGAEYDPDRPLQGIMAGITSRISAFNIDDTRSKNIATVEFDPLVVDDSAELMNYQQKKQSRLPPGLRSPSTTSSSSRPATPLSPRPTLTDALSSVAFSPKRPRNEAIIRPATGPVRSTRHPSRTQVKPTAVNAKDNAPTPRTRNKVNPSYSTFPQQSLSYATIVEPEVNVQPPTPSNPENISQPTRTTRGFSRETKAVHPRVNGLRTPYRDRVHLPDVTGLTSAIESPARATLEYLGYDAQNDAEINARLTATLGIVQAKLSNFEAQNSISRRRVRELELELEQCKQEVARERTRVSQREQIISQQRADVKAQKQRLADNARVAHERTPDDADRSRFKEVVEEQKALQALVMTLKGHLTRLTSELSDHHRLLEELRSLRDTDVRALKDKSREVDNLRQEVERLGGEVEVLRGVVEEGLKQRREVRDQSVEQSQSIHSDSKFVLRPNEELPENQIAGVDSDRESDDESSSARSAPSPTPSPQRRSRLADRTMRTDQATVGSPQGEADTNEHPFIDSHEIERISEEVSERRIERSSSMSMLSASQHRSHSQLSIRQVSPTPSAARSRSKLNGHSARQPTVADASDSDEEAPQMGAPVERVASPLDRRFAIRPQETRPTSSTHGEATKPTRDDNVASAEPPIRGKTKIAEAEPPLPRIRGAGLERLFFSAPDHHAHTCTVCNRRQRRKSAQRDDPWDTDLCDNRNLKERLRDAETQVEDEGDRAKQWTSAKGKGRAGVLDQDRVPPQTVLARVLRELEDDFTHYKEIYIELADQYKVIDPVTNVAKRNVLAEHLRDVIDILEQKGDQIASLYDLLTFKDKPIHESDAPELQKLKVAHASGPLAIS